MKLLLQIFRERKTSIAVLAALLLVNVALALAIFLWHAPRLEMLRNTWQQKRQLLASGGGDIAAVYRQGTHDLEGFGALIPPRRGFARVVGELFELAGNNGLEVTGITYKPGKVTGGMLEYSLGFSVKGKYAAVKSYFVDLQKFKEMVVVDHFSLSGQSPTEEAVDLRLALTIFLKVGAL